MICLTCATANSDSWGPSPRPLLCINCSSQLGIPTEGKGYLPQLKAIEDQLGSDQIDEDEADLRLQRFETAMAEMLMNVDTLSTKLLDANLDELQQANIANYIHPLRVAIVNLRDLANGLTLDVPWPAEVWQQLEAAQQQLLKGFQMQAQLLQMLAVQAMKGGLSIDQLKEMRYKA